VIERVLVGGRGGAQRILGVLEVSCSEGGSGGRWRRRWSFGGREGDLRTKRFELILPSFSSIQLLRKR